MIRAPYYPILFHVLLLVLLMLPTASMAETRYVQLASTSLRKQAKHWAPSVATLSYGQAVTVLEAREGSRPGWLYVRSGSKQGYLHESAVTEKQVVIKGKQIDKIDVSDSRDVVMAGKGFNDELEKLFKARARGADYRALDRMMAHRVSDRDVAEFVATGSLEKEVQ